MKKKTLIVVIIVALALGGLGIGFVFKAQNAMAAEVATVLGTEQNRPFARWRALNRLGLSEQQRTAVKAIVKKEYPKLEPNIRKMVDARRALRDAAQNSPTDEKLIRQRVNDVAAVGGDLAVELARIRAEVVALLTEDQKQILMSLQKERDARVDRLLATVSQRIKSLE